MKNYELRILYSKIKMMFNETIKYINFHNDSELPVNIASWIDGSNVLKTITVEPREKLIIHSSEGEWHLHSMLQCEKREIWRQKGLDKVFIIGKFRSQPCYLGKYAWLDYRSFECLYSELPDDVVSENKIRGLMTFSVKNENLQS
jgi:hypothetical protein